MPCFADPCEGNGLEKWTTASPFKGDLYNDNDDDARDDDDNDNDDDAKDDDDNDNDHDHDQQHHLVTMINRIVINYYEWKLTW